MTLSTMYRLCVMSQCTALLNRKSGFRGVSDSGFSSCTAPAYYFRSEYFYSQCPQVWKLIGTDHSLNREEHRVIIKLDLFPIIQKSEFGSQSDVRSDQRSSRQ